MRPKSNSPHQRGRSPPPRSSTNSSGLSAPGETCSLVQLSSTRLPSSGRRDGDLKIPSPQKENEVRQGPLRPLHPFTSPGAPTRPSPPRTRPNLPPQNQSQKETGSRPLPDCTRG